MTPYKNWNMAPKFRSIMHKLFREENVLFTQWNDFNRKPVKTEKEQFICVAKGNEMFRLASPIYRQNLYIGAFEELTSDKTPIDFYKLSFKRFPFVKDVNFLDVFLNEGDCMYVPAYFIYQQRSLGEKKNDMGYKTNSLNHLDTGSKFDSIIFKF